MIKHLKTQKEKTIITKINFENKISPINFIYSNISKSYISIYLYKYIYFFIIKLLIYLHIESTKSNFTLIMHKRILHLLVLPMWIIILAHHPLQGHIIFQFRPM